MAYRAWKLSDAERMRLLDLFPPAYPDEVAHHVTESFGVPADAAPPEPATFSVVGVADDGVKLQALVVSVNGSTERADGQTFHVTWSLDREQGAKPVDSNTVIRRKGFTPVDPVPFQAQPGVFR